MPIHDLQEDCSARLHIAYGLPTNVNGLFLYVTISFWRVSGPSQARCINYFALLENRVVADSPCDPTIPQIQETTSI